MAHSKFVGVDGCPAGWFSVGFTHNGSYEARGFFVFADLLAYYAGAELVLVDMPIGLPDGPNERECDPEAKANLGPRSPTVFRAPTRHTVNTAMRTLGNYSQRYNAANAAQRASAGVGLSTQSFSLVPKIHEVDILLPHQAPQVREVHPEICFWALNDAQPMGANKHTAQGIAERIRVLNAVESRTEKILAEARHKYPYKSVGKDDILDALAAAVTAYRGHPDRLQALPTRNGRDTPVQTDARNLPMEMVYWVPPRAE